ncbi:hypothetical protein IFM89_034381 [Coptis chinensis]|uniref:Uncharacterized protein n=1 Tax=Coptis chinensis TaxID=261450 RepID=A0A835J1Y3_9MAGN|nr:hypothetical protein IFM89_034381 [Coptis chinensis]
MKSNKTAGGLFLTEASKDKPSIGTTGVQIVYSKYAGTELEFYRSTHILLKEDDLRLIKSNKTAGGLILTEASKDKPSIGTVDKLKKKLNHKERIHHRESSAMLRDIAHISFVWLLCFGLQQLHSLFIVLSLDVKLMLKIWSHCFTCNDPGRVGVWCWSETGRTGKAVHFIAFYAPLWGAILFNGLTYFQVIRMINNATCMALGMSDRSHPSDTRADTKALTRWGYYPLILIGSWAFGTINRIHDFIEPGHKIFGSHFWMFEWLHLWVFSTQLHMVSTLQCDRQYMKNWICGVQKDYVDGYQLL